MIDDQEENFGPFSGYIKWNVIDFSTGKILRRGETSNIVVNSGKFALCSSMASGGGFELDTMRAGDVDTTFDASSTALGNTVGTQAITGSSVDNVITSEATIGFDGVYTVEEIGIFYGSSMWAASNDISESVSIQQGLFVSWEITLN